MPIRGSTVRANTQSPEPRGISHLPGAKAISDRQLAFHKDKLLSPDLTWQAIINAATLNVRMWDFRQQLRKAERHAQSLIARQAKADAAVQRVRYLRGVRRQIDRLITAEIKRRLWRSEIIGFGKILPETFTTKLEQVPPDWWRWLKIDFDHATASGPDISYGQFKFAIVILSDMQGLRDAIVNALPDGVPRPRQPVGLPPWFLAVDKRMRASEYSRPDAKGPKPARWDLIRVLIEERAAAGQTLRSLKGEARELSRLAMERYPGQRIPAFGSILKHLRAIYRWIDVKASPKARQA